jgi:hypothetical protein
VAGGRSLEVGVEVLGRQPGYWCPQCRCPSGIAVVFVFHYPNGRMVCAKVAKCHECGMPVPLGR